MKHHTNKKSRWLARNQSHNSTTQRRLRGLLSPMQIFLVLVVLSNCVSAGLFLEETEYAHVLDSCSCLDCDDEAMEKQGHDVFLCAIFNSLTWSHSRFKIGKYTTETVCIITRPNSTKFRANIKFELYAIEKNTHLTLSFEDHGKVKRKFRPYFLTRRCYPIKAGSEYYWHKKKDGNAFKYKLVPGMLFEYLEKSKCLEPVRKMSGKTRKRTQSHKKPECEPDKVLINLWMSNLKRQTRKWNQPLTKKFALVKKNNWKDEDLVVQTIGSLKEKGFKDKVAVYAAIPRPPRPRPNVEDWSNKHVVEWACLNLKVHSNQTLAKKLLLLEKRETNGFDLVDLVEEDQKKATATLKRMGFKDKAAMLEEITKLIRERDKVAVYTAIPRPPRPIRVEDWSNEHVVEWACLNEKVHAQDKLKLLEEKFNREPKKRKMNGVDLLSVMELVKDTSEGEDDTEAIATLSDWAFKDEAAMLEAIKKLKKKTKQQEESRRSERTSL